MQSSHSFLSRLLHYRSSKHTTSILVPFLSPTQNTDTKENAAAAASTCSKNLSCLRPIFTNQNPTFPFGSYAQSSGVFFGNSPKGVVFLGYHPLGNDQKQQNWHQFLSHRRFFTRAKQIKKIEINDQHSQRAVTTALWCNFLVFSPKFGVRLSTSSHVMLAEVVHAVADFANQALLAYGLNRSRHAPDALHLPPEHMEYAALVLGGSFIIEGASLIVAAQAVRKGAAAEGMTVRDYVWRGHDSTAVAVMTEAGRLTRAGKARPEAFNRRYSSMAQCIIPTGSTARTAFTVEDQCDQQATSQNSDRNAGGMKKHQIGKNVSRRDKVDFLLKTFLNLKDNKEAVYGALDAWVAWEQDFPLVSLRRALIALEKEHQWHRVIQVIKWMLSKGQGKTMGTYMQLIRALDMEHRAEEAHIFWQKRIGSDLHSVPWQLCNLMIGVYYRNNMLEHLVKLFKRLEAFDRKPPERSIVQKVADAYEMLGMPEEKERIELKFSNLFLESVKDHSKKSRHASSKKKKKSGKKNQTPTPDISADVAVGMDNVID